MVRSTRELRRRAAVSASDICALHTRRLALLQPAAGIGLWTMGSSARTTGTRLHVLLVHCNHVQQAQLVGGTQATIKESQFTVQHAIYGRPSNLISPAYGQPSKRDHSYLSPCCLDGLVGGRRAEKVTCTRHISASITARARCPSVLTCKFNRDSAHVHA